MSWTQPICAPCYDAWYPGRQPSRVIDADEETCCNCAAKTSDGIYVRVNPAEVAHATREKE
jgi:hypothetical protein